MGMYFMRIEVLSCDLYCKDSATSQNGEETMIQGIESEVTFIIVGMSCLLLAGAWLLLVGSKPKK